MRPYWKGYLKLALNGRPYGAIGASRLDFRHDAPYRDPTAWLPFLDTYRTMCRAPEPAFRRTLEGIRELRFAVLSSS
jgi:hypothetical protein